MIVGVVIKDGYVFLGTVENGIERAESAVQDETVDHIYIELYDFVASKIVVNVLVEGSSVCDLPVRMK